MYQSFYKLDKKPFEVNSDLSFLWLGEKHREALSTLHYGILENKGFLLLTGDSGSGKTILVQALTENLEENIQWAVITDPRLERIEFYNAIAKAFGIGKPFTSKVQFLIQFSHFLHKADDEKKKVLLLVDDCHLLSQDMLEELRLLSNIEKADAKLINIFFIGRPEFQDILVEPRNRAVRQRLTLKAELPALSPDETYSYIRHRLKIAGTDEKLFTAKAVQAIHRAAQGIPRLINSLCDHALASGAVKTRKVIDNKMIEACILELNLPVNFPQEESVAASDEKIDSRHFNGTFIPKAASEPPSFSGFNIENENKYGWFKYSLGLLVIAAVGTYFWFALLPHSVHNDQNVPVESTKVPVVRPIPQIPQVTSSPAVTMLKENKTVMNAEKAAELKTAILEKAYSNNGVQQEMKNFHDEEAEVKVSTPTAGDDHPVGTAVVAKTANMPEQKAAGQVQAAEQVVVSEPAMVAESSVDDEEILQHELPEKTIEVPTVAPLPESKQEPEIVSTPLEPSVPPMPPMEPRKMILGLQPNGLKLTNAAQKEFDSYVERLKLYPDATIVVKGFVSAKSNTPDNIKLSKDRALGVQKLLLEKGIDAAQVEVVGMGNQEPIASNTTSEGRRKNRRVEIIIVNDGISEGGGN